MCVCIYICIYIYRYIDIYLRRAVLPSSLCDRRASYNTARRMLYIYREREGDMHIYI